MPPDLAAAALAEVRARLSVGDDRPHSFEMGMGFAACRFLQKLPRRFKKRHAAKRSWQMVSEQRFLPGLQPLERMPACFDLLLRATASFELPPELSDAAHCRDCLNVIVRAYRPGDWLGRHVDDIRLFEEPVLSVVLEPGGPSDGLLLSLPSTLEGCLAAREEAMLAGARGLRADAHSVGSRVPSMVRESQGLALCLQREARYIYGHEVPRVSRERVSMTWRWFRRPVVDECRGVEAWMRGADLGAQAGAS